MVWMQRQSAILHRILPASRFDEMAYFNKTILVDLGAPDFGITYAEVCFLKCEAVLRGWITGDATALYNAGVAASMTQWGIYTGITVPSDAEIQAYLTANPFDGSYKMIGEQMYLTFWRQFGRSISVTGAGPDIRF